MIRKFAAVWASILLAVVVGVFAAPFAIRKYAEAKVDAALSQIGYQTTSMVQRGDVSVDVWSWTVNVGAVEIMGAGAGARTTIGQMIITAPSDAGGRMVAERIILDDVKIKGPGETISVPRAEIRGYSAPADGLTATPGLGRNTETQADIFEKVSIGRLVAPVLVFSAESTGLRRNIRNLVVNDMRGGVINSLTADAITLEAAYLPAGDDAAPSSMLISTGAVRYDGLSLPTLWRFRDGDRQAERRQLLKSVSISDMALSMTLRTGGRFSGSVKKLEVGEIGLQPLGFEISAFDPISTGMRFSKDATPQEIREQMAFGVSLLRSASFARVAVTDAQAQLTSAGEPQRSGGFGFAEVGPYADARVETAKFDNARYSNVDGLKFGLEGGRAYGFDASGLLAYADRVAGNEVLLTTKPTPEEMLKIIPRIKALDAQNFELSNDEGEIKVDRARVDLDAPLDAVPQNVMFRLDGLDASPPVKSAAQKWISKMELDNLKGSAKFSLTLDPKKNELSLDWLDYSFDRLGAVTASGKLERVDPVLAVSTGADFVEKFSAIRLAPFKVTLKDDGATDVLLRRAAAKAGETPEVYREHIAVETQDTIARLLGPSAEKSAESAAEFIRDPRSAEITLAPRKMDQTLLELIRAIDLGPAGIAQVVDLSVLYRR